MRVGRVILLFFVLLMSMQLKAQDDAEFRMEIGGGIGTNVYIGDANNQFLKQPCVAVGFVWKYLFNPRSAFKTSLAYGGVRGACDVNTDFYPPSPETPGVSTTTLDYKFSSYVVDLSCLYEINFWPYGYYQGYMGYKRFTPFLQVGLGATYVGCDGRLTANIPLGAGVKYRLGKRVNVAFDWTAHFCMSDKVDGLSDPIGIQSKGFKNKDLYHTAMFTLTYNISPICPTCNKD